MVLTYEVKEIDQFMNDLELRIKQLDIISKDIDMLEEKYLEYDSSTVYDR